MIEFDKVNTDEALRYMGYKNNIDIDNIIPIIKKCEENLINAAKGRYCYKIFDICRENDKLWLSGTSLILEGKDIFKHLEGCNKAVLMACTITEKVDRLINMLNISDMSSALITDALASALIEQLCNKVEEIIKNELDIKNMTWRFSPGYGDLPIEIQREFIKTINADKQIGLTVTPSNILIPRKSVTAIIGISDSPVPKGKRGCAICNMAKNCQYRKRGSHCGF